MKQYKNLAQSLLAWYKVHGRPSLPWRKNIHPYRVWVSEIMLQQTQVTTALPYFDRFLQHFPTLNDLAQSELSEVLNLWSGLGYYARARNLHRSAQIIMAEHGGNFPSEFESLCALPGIGRSTAGAIQAIAQQKFGVILDGNVRRVLSRLFCLASPSLKILWDYAHKLTPKKNSGDYAQAIMDLGAMICLPKNPKCEQCPINHHCRAFLTQRVNEFPVKNKKKDAPTRQAIWLIIQNTKGEILLWQQPAEGLWGGLWCFPSYADLDNDPQLDLQNRFKLKTHLIEKLPSFTHVFSHFRLQIFPWLCHTRTTKLSSPEWIWYHGQRLATPSPVTQLLNQLKQ